jgi:hypothetical protein
VYLTRERDDSEPLDVRPYWRGCRLLALPPELAGGAEHVLALVPEGLRREDAAESAAALVLRGSDAGQVRAGLRAGRAGKARAGPRRRPPAAGWARTTTPGPAPGPEAGRLRPRGGAPLPHPPPASPAAPPHPTPTAPPPLGPQVSELRRCLMTSKNQMAAVAGLLAAAQGDLPGAGAGAGAGGSEAGGPAAAEPVVDVFEEAFRHQTFVELSGHISEVALRVSGRQPDVWCAAGQEPLRGPASAPASGWPALCVGAQGPGEDPRV